MDSLFDFWLLVSVIVVAIIPIILLKLFNLTEFWPCKTPPEPADKYVALYLAPPDQSARIKELEGLLGDLHALVVGESPRLLDDDGGGSGHLDMRIRAALGGEAT